MTDIYCYIPARLKSSRFPNKMLKPINDKPLVNYVYDKCLKGKYFKKVIVATCDNLIKKVEEAGGEAVLTSHLHKGCISRIAEAVLKK